MATLEELVISLVAETSGLRAELDKASKATVAATSKMEDAVKSFADNSSKKVGFFESAMATMTGFLGSHAVLGVFHALEGAAHFLVEELIHGAQEAIVEEKAMVRLANAMALSGHYSTEAAHGMSEFIDRMEESTGVTKDVIANNLTLLSSLTKLDSEGLQKAQQAALDLASATGKDLNSATMAVARSIEGSNTALTRMGIKVQDGTTKSENLANTLKALAGVSGSAAGAMHTFGGAMTGVENAYDNLLKAGASTVIQSEAIKIAIMEVGKILNENVPAVEENTAGYRDLAGSVLIGVIDALKLITRAFNFLITTANLAADGMSLPFEVIATAGKAASEALDGNFGTAWDSIKNGASIVADDLASDFGGSSALNTITTDLDRIEKAAQSGMGAISEGANGTIAPTVAAGKAVAKLTAAEITRRENLKSMVSALAETTAALDSEYKFQQDSLQANLDFNLASTGDNHAAQQALQLEFFSAKSEALTTQQADELALLEEDHALKLTTEQQYQDAKTALQNKQTLESIKMATDYKKFETKANQEKIADLQSTFSTIATLSSSSNKTLAAIGKAAAITNATIDGYAAVQKALASAPPPFNFALAALVGVATAANVSKIAGVGLAGGIDSVPGSGNKDNFPAVLAPGERVVTADQNRDLTDFLSNQGSGGGNVVIELRLQDQMVEFIEAKILERQRIGISLLQGAV